MARDRLTFVQKVSKFCNLRCGYCYEYRELADPRRMQRFDLRRMFECVGRYADASGVKGITFVWHGGEPFLVPLKFYEEVGRLQRDILGEEKLFNAVQTNLTVLTPRHLAFLKEGAFFSGLGVSFDVYGDQRVDVVGRLKTDLVLRNMQILIDNGVPFGAIAVLARNTLPHVAGIYRFFDELGVSVRMLAFYKQADERQAAVHGVAYDEVLQAYRTLFELWAASPRATPVDPIEGFIDGAIAVIAGERVAPFSIKDDEHAFLVAPDGSVWGEADGYDPAFRYGDLTQDSLDDILSSPGRTKAVAEAEQRVDALCKPCPFRHYCSGEFVATATKPQRELLQAHGCLRREMLSYVAERLEREALPRVAESAVALCASRGRTERP